MTCWAPTSWSTTILAGRLSTGQDPASSAPAETPQIHVEERLEFLNNPGLWVLCMVILPLVIGFAWWSYGGLTRIEPRTRAILSVLRGLAIAVCLVANFQPVMEVRQFTQIRSQVHLLVDDSPRIPRRDT